MSETIAEIVASHRTGRAIVDTIRVTYARIAAHDDPAIFIALRPETDALADAARLDAAGASARDLPLLGVPFAVKDNIDVEGLPTTAACPAFAYSPAGSATVVARLVAAGAIPVGKTNLDQFATGLVGTRSPYGVPRNAVDAALVPGGSSSGSAVAVAAGLVPFALGTDTAGSGRVPAGLNRIVGLKPSLGALSTSGVVPACRTLDCVSVFALTVDDAWHAFEVAAGYDADDPYSRKLGIGMLGGLPPSIRLGVPDAASRVFFGDAQAEAAFDAALAVARRIGATLVEVDLSPHLETARLLYQGPWVAERLAVVRDLLARDPAAIHPVTRAIVEKGAGFDAVATFEAHYKLAALRRAADAVWTGLDALLVPTAPSHYTLAEVEADAFGLNARLGTYTNFVNLLDLCGLAVPGPDRADGRPAGVTLLAPAGRDAQLATLGRALQAVAAMPLGATGRAVPALAPMPVRAPAGHIELAVVGAHLSGMALNRELVERGAILLRAVETTRDYRLFALPGGPPERPGLVRIADGQGAAIATEVWALTPEAFGSFVAGIPAPLGIGTVRLADGTAPKGFLCEAEATRVATDIGHHGGWRAYMGARLAGAA